MAERLARVILHVDGDEAPDVLATIAVDVLGVRPDGTIVLDAELLADALVEIAVAVVDPSKRPLQ
jgi:hypothetical protein